MTVQLPGVTTKRCPTCRTRPRMLDRSYCDICENERRKRNKLARQLARAQGIAPRSLTGRKAPGERDACNCGDRSCSGLRCNFVRVGA